MRNVKQLIMALTITTACCTMCLAFDDGDFQYWNTEKISWGINDDWKMSLEEEFRFGDDASDFYYQHSDVGVAYSGIAQWLDVGMNYRGIFEESNDDWSYEHRPHFNCTVTFNVSDFKMSNRSRVEYRDRETGSDVWRYRNKFTLTLPCKLTQFEIQPYIADELFTDFDKEQIDRNRVYGGVSFKLLEHLKGELFHLWQSSKKSGRWTDYYILGTKLKVSF